MKWSRPQPKFRKPRNSSGVVYMVFARRGQLAFERPAADLPNGTNRGLVPLGPVFFRAGHKDLTAGVLHPIEQRQKTSPPPGIQFSHDIVNQQNWRRSVNGGQVFSLGHFQGDGDRPLLPLAAKLLPRQTFHSSRSCRSSRCGPVTVNRRDLSRARLRDNSSAKSARTDGRYSNSSSSAVPAIRA